MSIRSNNTLDRPTPVTTPKTNPSSERRTATDREHSPKSQSPDQRRRDVKVQLQYLCNDPLYETVKPIQITPNFADSEGKTNVRLESGPSETIIDARGRNFTLDDNGFCYVNAPTKFKDWSSQPQIAKEYLPELEDVLREHVDGCDEIVFYDARIRQAGDEGARVSGLSYNPFARQVHVDNTETSVKEKIHNITDLKAEYYLSGRCRIINIWRPIKHPVYDCGLAIADGGKLRDGDVIECDRIRQSTGKYWDTMGVVKYRPGFDWYYMSLQDEPDVLLFKNYDSSMDVAARNCLHTAFDLPPEDIPPGAPTRESIEVRAFVFTLPKGVRKPSGVAVPHPLAIGLEQWKLRHFDEGHSITDRLRTDIDEGNEVKDAVLLLRKQEIRRLERTCEALISERDQHSKDLQESQMELEYAHQQMAIQANQIEVLQQKLVDQEAKLKQKPDQLREQVTKLSEDLKNAEVREHALKSQTPSIPEVDLLTEHIKRQEDEIMKWKEEAYGRGNEAVSRVWQDSVNEAVRRERQKDEEVIRSLHQEIESLKSKGT
jgi:hypothetical protein